MRNRTAAWIQKKNFYGVGGVRFFAYDFIHLYTISAKREM